MSIAIASSNFILVSLFVCTARIYFMSSDDLLFLLFFITHNTKTLACKLNSDLKANLNRHPYVIQPELYLNEKFNLYYDL